MIRCVFNGFYANDDDFTNLCQLNVQEPAALEGASCFLLPIPETGYAVDGAGELTDATLVDYIRNEGGTGMIKQRTGGNGFASLLKKGSFLKYT